MGTCWGKTALVTNASQLPGKAAAIALAHSGARVLVHDQYLTSNVEAVVETILAAGGIAKAAAADLSTPEGSRQLAQLARAVIGDRLDILVMDSSAMDPQVQVHLAELLLPILNRGSSVIFICPRCVPRVAIAGKLRQIASSLKTRGVRVNALETEGSRSEDSKTIGAAITFLASDDSTGMNGATIRWHPLSNAWRDGVPLHLAPRESRP